MFLKFIKTYEARRTLKQLSFVAQDNEYLYIWGYAQFWNFLSMIHKSHTQEVFRVLRSQTQIVYNRAPDYWWLYISQFANTSTLLRDFKL